LLKRTADNTPMAGRSRRLLPGRADLIRADTDGGARITLNALPAQAGLMELGKPATRHGLLFKGFVGCHALSGGGEGGARRDEERPKPALRSHARSRPWSIMQCPRLHPPRVQPPGSPRNRRAGRPVICSNGRVPARGARNVPESRTRLGVSNSVAHAFLRIDIHPPSGIQWGMTVSMTGGGPATEADRGLRSVGFSG